jgi:hypothetical protein
VLRGWTTTREAESSDDDVTQTMLGRLVFSRVDVECENAPLARVLKALTDTLALNISPKYGMLLPSEGLINLTLSDVDGRSALEAIIAQGGASATWQLHRGIIEIGDREYLARDAARRTQIYDISMLTLDHPYRVPPRKGSLTPVPRPTEPDADIIKRKAPIQIAADLMQTIADQIEPEAWDPRPQVDSVDGTPRPAPTLPNGGAGSDRNASTMADRNFDPKLGPPYVKGKWAQLAYYVQGGHLIVSAPDFVHRGIAGYPPALPPVVSQ